MVRGKIRAGPMLSSSIGSDVIQIIVIMSTFSYADNLGIARKRSIDIL